MKMLRYLLAIALVCGLSGVARAADFQMVVVDPIVPLDLITPITGSTFTFDFSPCDPSQLPTGLTYQGCFTGENETGKPLTSIEMLIPVFGGQTAGCDKLAGTLDLFSSITCGTTADGKDFYLDFSGGNIPTAKGINGDCDGDNDGGSNRNSDDGACIFTIAENGVVAGNFPPVAATVNAPEPSPIWLMSTGVLSIGLFGAYRRRQILCEPRP